MSNKYKKPKLLPKPKPKLQKSTNEQTGATRGDADMKSAYMQEAMQKAKEEQRRRAEAARREAMQKEIERRRKEAEKNRSPKGGLGTAPVQQEAAENKSLKGRMQKYKKKN